MPSGIFLERPDQFINFVTDTTERISWSVTGRGDAPVDIVLFRTQTEVGKIAENLQAGLRKQSHRLPQGEPLRNRHRVEEDITCHETIQNLGGS